MEQFLFLKLEEEVNILVFIKLDITYMVLTEWVK